MDGFHPQLLEHAALERRHRPSVARIVETEVIPRLLQTRMQEPDRQARALAAKPAHVDTLARLTLSRDDSGAQAQVEALRRNGMTTETVLDEVVAPSARLLGQMWREDAVSFIDVAMGCGRLATIIRRIGVDGDATGEAAAPRALVTTLPGERHGLGAMILAHHLRLNGWAVSEVPGAAHGALRRLAGATRWDMIALSLGDMRSEREASATVSMIRCEARRYDPIIAVGGPAALVAGDLGARLGADFCCTDAGKAVRRANALLSQRNEAVKTRSAT